MASTRERILEAALHLFASRGYEGTSVTDIEVAVGLAAGTGSFYRHFRNKEDVLRAVVDAACAGELFADVPSLPRGRPAGRAEKRVDERSRLRSEFVDALDGLARQRSLIVLLARLRGRFPDLEQKIYEASLHGWIRGNAVLVEGRPGNSLALSTVVTSALVGYHLARDFFGHMPADIDPDEFADTLADLVMSAAP